MREWYEGTTWQVWLNSREMKRVKSQIEYVVDEGLAEQDEEGGVAEILSVALDEFYPDGGKDQISHLQLTEEQYDELRDFIHGRYGEGT